MKMVIKRGITTYKRSKYIWDYYLPKAKYFLNKNYPKSEKMFLSLTKIFFRKYNLQFKEEKIINILKEHNDIVDYSKVKHETFYRKLTLFALRYKLNYPELYVEKNK